MPCPVTCGFLHSLEHAPEEKTRNTSFEFVVDGLGTFPDLRLRAKIDPTPSAAVSLHRSQFAVQTTLAWMHVRAPLFLSDLLDAVQVGPEAVLKKTEELRGDLGDLLFVSKLKRKTDGANLHTLSERLTISGGLEALQQQLEGLLKVDYPAVGYGLGTAFRRLCLPSDQALKVGRRILAIKV